METIALHPNMGVELKGVNLNEELSEDEISEIRELFASHHLLLVRDQELSPADHDRFIGYLGPLKIRANGTHEEFVSNRNKEDISGSKRLLFHNDSAFRDDPHAATSLYALEVSEDSAPTSFVNLVHAYDTLPQNLRTRVEPLHALHVLELGTEEHVRIRVPDLPPEAPKDLYPQATHPIALPIPKIGKTSLFVGEHQTSHIVELPLEEGEGLLQELFDRIYKDDQILLHKYRNGDVVVFDNLALQHGRPIEAGSGVRHPRRLVVESPV